MAGHKAHIIAKRPKLLRDAVQQVLMIAFGKICPPDRAAKQHIANKGNFLLLNIAHDMAGPMPRRMGDV